MSETPSGGPISDGPFDVTTLGLRPGESRSFVFEMGGAAPGARRRPKSARESRPPREAPPGGSAGPARHRADCVHLAGPTGRSVEQLRCGCGQKFVSVWSCELFGDSAPFARGELVDAGVRRCADCAAYERGPNNPPGGE